MRRPLWTVMLASGTVLGVVEGRDALAALVLGVVLAVKNGARADGLRVTRVLACPTA